MIDEALIQDIVKIVMRKLESNKKKDLVVFTETDKGVERIIETLSNIDKQDVIYDILMSRNAYEILDLEKIKDKLSPDNVWVGKANKSAEELTKEYNRILVPSLAINSSSRISACMTVDEAENTIFSALMQGKDVIIAIDGCCPDCLSKIPRINMTEALKMKLKMNLKTLESFGARLVVSSEFDELSTSLLYDRVDVMKTENIFQGKIVSEKEIKKLHTDSVLKVRPETIVTQMALDIARQKNVTIKLER